MNKNWPDIVKVEFLAEKNVYAFIDLYFFEIYIIIDIVYTQINHEKYF